MRRTEERGPSHDMRVPVRIARRSNGAAAAAGATKPRKSERSVERVVVLRALPTMIEEAGEEEGEVEDGPDCGGGRR